jgi:hypothetical protein
MKEHKLGIIQIYQLCPSREVVLFWRFTIDVGNIQEYILGSQVVPFSKVTIFCRVHYQRVHHIMHIGVGTMGTVGAIAPLIFSF